MRGVFKLGKFAGIEIGVHYTWFFAFILFTWLFAQNTLPGAYPGWAVRTYWIVGTVLSLLLFGSVLVHELCHSLVAIRRGMKVSGIILFILGGVSNMESEPESARVEFLMAGAGPLSSLILGIIFMGIALVIDGYNILTEPLIVTIFYLGVMNISLAVFNLIPGFPLDGGRVLRSIIWGKTKNLYKATMIAGNIGRFFGWAMILFGIALIFTERLWIFQGGLASGIWLVFIGWFLTSAADNTMREKSLQQHLAGIKVKDVMDRTPECVNPAASVESVVHGSFILRGRRSLPVCVEKGLVGIVTLADVKRLPQDLWANTPVQEIMTRSPLLSVDQEEDLNKALQILAKNGLNQIPVFNVAQFVGLLSRSDVIRYLQTRQELGIKTGQM
jgi:Zn-dependent protease/CBS domain-containing protein